MSKKPKAINYIELIKQRCENAETYQECFESVIEQLAQIMERRQIAYNQFVEGGSKMIVTYTNKGGAENEVTNPLLKIINELDSMSLSFWRELGLTPKSFRAFNDSVGTGQIQKGSLTASIFSIEKANGKAE